MNKFIIISGGLAIVAVIGAVFLTGESAEKPVTAVSAPAMETATAEVPARSERVLPESLPPKPVMAQPETAAPKAYRFGKAETVLSNKLELELGRKAAYDMSLDRTSGPWRLVCGRPSETDGKPFDYNRSKMKTDYNAGDLEGKFCAVFKDRAGDQELVAFDLGSTDNYVAGWAEKLGLPPELTE